VFDGPAAAAMSLCTRSCGECEEFERTERAIACDQHNSIDRGPLRDPPVVRESTESGGGIANSAASATEGGEEKENEAQLADDGECAVAAVESS
jgi:hypothetical protein